MALDTINLGGNAERVSGYINGFEYVALATQALVAELPDDSMHRRTYTPSFPLLRDYYCNQPARLWIPRYLVEQEEEGVRLAHDVAYIFPWNMGYQRFSMKGRSEEDIAPHKANINAQIIQERQERALEITRTDLPLLTRGSHITIDPETLKYEMITPPIQTRLPAPFHVKIAGLLLREWIPSMGVLEKAVRFKIKLG